MTECVLFVKKEENQESAVPEMPYMCISINTEINGHTKESISRKVASRMGQKQKQYNI